MNGAGWIIVILGLLVAIIGLRGTQKQVFPWFFGDSSSSSNNDNPTPDAQGKCPPGYFPYQKWCLKQVIY